MFNILVDEIESIREAVLSFTNYIKVWGGTERDMQTGKLIAYELISNVLTHSRCPAKLTARRQKGCLEITVEGFGSCLGKRQVDKPSLDTSRGRGLFIVSKLCDKLILLDTKTIAQFLLDK